NRSRGRLSFTGHLEEGVGQTDVIFICVGTPCLPNGEADLSAVEQVARRIAETVTGYKLVVEKSTVPVQTGRWIERTLANYNGGLAECDVASNPEFLREGSAVEDFLHPDRIVVGVGTARAEKLLRDVYAPIVDGSFACPIHDACAKGQPVPFLVTDIESAELIKHASNAFLAMKISFINALADLCERAGAEVTWVAQGVGLDRRIGQSFLNAGIGFGGYCFPKDLQAFVKIAEKLGYDFALLTEVERINHSRAAVVLEKLKEHLWILKGKRIGVWGLAFKPNTDDVREAPAFRIIELLRHEGAEVRAYDPKAMENAQAELQGVTLCEDAYEAADGAEALILATEWEDFKGLDLSRVKARMKLPFFLDGRNFFDKEAMRELGFEYVGMGR
ncbi:MAG: UDP-glucose dehydrogenase family protein, partial [Candidatus Binatia bacterium]